MPWRNFIRWAALLCMIAVALWLAPNAGRNYRNWRESAVNDPSAAELYRTGFWMDAVGIVVALMAGSSIFFGLKKKEVQSQGSSSGF